MFDPGIASVATSYGLVGLLKQLMDQGVLTGDQANEAIRKGAATINQTNPDRAAMVQYLNALMPSANAK